jgi:hypothetical protein
MDASQLAGWFKLPQRVLWALLFVSGLILWGPEPFVSGLGLGEFIAEYRMYLGVVFLLLLAATLPTLIHWLGKWCLAKWRSRKALISYQRKLLDLTPEEKKVLRGYLDGNTKTQYLDVSDGVAASLTSAGIIYMATQVSSAYTDFAYNIQPWAWDHLRKNPELVNVV